MAAEDSSAPCEIGDSETIETITAAGLRGRGGAGFSTGRKWASVRDGGTGTRFVVANGAEGEPATFKDRTLIRLDPYRIVEGAAIAALAVGAGTVYLATKRSYRREVQALTRAAVEMSAAGLLQELSVNIVEGPNDYLYGEEKALLEVIEGRDPLPRLLPPYELGLFATGLGDRLGGRCSAGLGSCRVQPDGRQQRRDAGVRRAHHGQRRGVVPLDGHGESPGTVIATVVGDVQRPGVHEVEMGTPFSAAARDCAADRCRAGPTRPRSPACRMRC